MKLGTALKALLLALLVASGWVWNALAPHLLQEQVDDLLAGHAKPLVAAYIQPGRMSSLQGLDLPDQVGNFGLHIEVLRPYEGQECPILPVTFNRWMSEGEGHDSTLAITVKNCGNAPAHDLQVLISYPKYFTNILSETIETNRRLAILEGGQGTNHVKVLIPELLPDESQTFLLEVDTNEVPSISARSEGLGDITSVLVARVKVEPNQTGVPEPVEKR